MDTFHNIKKSINSLLQTKSNKGSEIFNEALIENEAGFIQFKNTDDQPGIIPIEIDKGTILFSFSLEGRLEYDTSLDAENLAQDGENYLVISYPYEDWKMKLTVEPGAKVLLLCLPIRKLHDFINIPIDSEGNGMEEMMKDYKARKFYSYKKVTPAISITLHQIFNNTIKEPFRNLYLSGKIIEFITHYLNGSDEREKAELECPFLSDSYEKEKIKNARELVIENMSDPPGIPELARAVGTNEYKLKVGFKKLYGNTVYGYLNDLRMDTARELLEIQDLPIKEVAYRVGYSNTSHFIASFKKKFGVTPKKYLKSVKS